MLTDPVDDWGKAEFVPLHRALDECMFIHGFDLDVKAVPPQEDIGGGESDALITVEEGILVAERLHQRGSFFFDGIVIADLAIRGLAPWRPRFCGTSTWKTQTCIYESKGTQYSVGNGT